jgi:hypothetical protein
MSTVVPLLGIRWTCQMIAMLDRRGMLYDRTLVNGNCYMFMRVS